MLKNYLLITLRSLMKNKVFVIINVLGIGIAVACCIVAYLNNQYDATWDSQFKNASSIYRIQFWYEFQDHKTRNGIAPMPMAANIRQNFPDVDNVVRYADSGGDFRIGDQIFNANVGYVDSAFFDLFTYELKYGRFDDFHDKSKIFISDFIAKKYFNKEDVVGQPLTQIINGKPKEYIIGGVFKRPPTNTSFSSDAFAMFENHLEPMNRDRSELDSWKIFTTTFLQIKDPSRLEAITDRLQQFVEPQNKAREDFKVKNFYLENFAGIAQRARIEPRLNNEWLRSGMPKEAIWLPNLMAVLLLLLACFNFTNTSIAASSQRIKEIGVRKVMGGVRRQLVLQFLGENLLLCFVGLLVGLLVAEWLVPAYDNLWVFIDLKLSYTENAGFLLFLVALLLGTGLIAGSYPAFYITSFEPITILKGKLKFGGTNWFTRILLWFQFTISVMSITFAVAFYENANYQRDYDLGFATKGVISVWVNDEAGYTTFRDAVSTNKDITHIAGSRHHLTNGWKNDPIKYESTEKEVDIMEVGDEYMDVMDMKLISGRGFKKDSETDMKESVIVSEELVKKFGWKDDAIGKKLIFQDTLQFYVIGVIKDVYARALWRPVEPMMLRYTPKSNYALVLVSAPIDKIKSVYDFMGVKWKSVFPNTQFSGQYIDDKLNETLEINNNVVKMFSFLGFFAILLSATGLYTLVSLNILKKMKEIGVRKVLGASRGNIARVINLEFAIVLFIAALCGGAVGYLVSGIIMDSVWVYHKKLDVVSFAMSVAAMFAIAALAVSFKTVKTASMNPVKTLRDE